MNNQYLHAIVKYRKYRKVQAAKYHNIKNANPSIERFRQFVDKTFPAWTVIFFYRADNRLYVGNYSRTRGLNMHSR